MKRSISTIAAALLLVGVVGCDTNRGVDSGAGEQFGDTQLGETETSRGQLNPNRTQQGQIGTQQQLGTQPDQAAQPDTSQSQTGAQSGAQTDSALSGSTTDGAQSGAGAGM